MAAYRADTFESKVDLGESALSGVIDSLVALDVLLQHCPTLLFAQ